MIIASKNQAIERRNSDTCLVMEYPALDKDNDLDMAIVTISGRYPAHQRVVNRRCKEIVYVQQGAGKIVLDEIEYSLNSGDVVLVEAGKKYYWEGEMVLCIACNPAFDITQHQPVP